MGTRLYVGNLSFSSTNETVREAFARIGEVTDVHIVTDRTSGQSRGFGFVTMGSPAEATKAIESMNGANLDGRPLRVNEAEERPQRIVVKDGARVHVIPIDKLDYVEAQDDYVALHSGGKSYLKQQPIASLESLLDPARILERR